MDNAPQQQTSSRIFGWIRASVEKAIIHLPVRPEVRNASRALIKLLLTWRGGSFSVGIVNFTPARENYSHTVMYLPVFKYMANLTLENRELNRPS